jgi:asparagine synthase (glutamine-hydrolysing)
MPSKPEIESPAYPFQEHSERLAAAIAEACAAATAGRGRVAVAFSGGLDSALLAAMCKRTADVGLYVAGKRGCHDFKAAAEAAEALSLPVTEIVIEPSSLREVSKLVASSIINPAPIEIAVAVPFAYVCRAASESAVVTGTGADELFGGYARYSRMSPETRTESMRGDTTRLRGRGAVAEAAIAARLGKEALQPYLHLAVEAVAGAVPAEGHLWNGRNKALLREAALRSSLPQALAERPKKAAQYGSGVARMLAKVE